MIPKDERLIQRLIKMKEWSDQHSSWLPKPKTPTMRQIAGFIERNYPHRLTAKLADTYHRPENGKIYHGVSIIVTRNEEVVWEYDTLDKAYAGDTIHQLLDALGVVDDRPACKPIAYKPIKYEIVDEVAEMEHLLLKKSTTISVLFDLLKQVEPLVAHGHHGGCTCPRCLVKAQIKETLESREEL